MKDYSRLKEHCYQTLKLPTSPKTTAEHLMVLELIEYYEEHEAVLDKIRAEIKNHWHLKKYPSSPFACGLRQAIEIIDKYRAESEE